MNSSSKDITGFQFFKDWIDQYSFLSKSLNTRMNHQIERHQEFLSNQWEHFWRVSDGLVEPINFAKASQNYALDRFQRLWITYDTIEHSLEQIKEHQEDGALPFLNYQYEVVLDGRSLKPASNYCLLKIIPPSGQIIDKNKRAYIIIDPRAGHGPGIGGFKQDSQVGVALSKGHPVYFVAFAQKPEPEQTIADVTSCEAKFVSEVQARHPNSEKPIVIGNCQGGWATAILAATHPNLTGPIVLNGAPMSYWSGKLGQDPMRYSGGIMGGALPAIISSDLNAGEFDGANLVFNFESQNPARTWFRKYYELFANVDDQADKFVEFEKWWSTFYFMTDHEIKWIVENLFIGNKLANNRAQLDAETPINLKLIRAPIIVFASHGDNITPPGQALNWIMDVYENEQEIKLAGQKIIYLVHEDIGHLGIFVSSRVAQKEHTQFVSVLEAIEAIPPGLYQMHIETISEGDTEYLVNFSESHFKDIIEVTGKRDEERVFENIANISEQQTQLYEATMQPIIKLFANYAYDQHQSLLHPARISRHPWLGHHVTIAYSKEMVKYAKKHRVSLADKNAWVSLETMLVNNIEHTIDNFVAIKEASIESEFFSVWASPLARVWDRLSNTKTDDSFNNGFTGTVLHALTNVDSGGEIAGYIRIILLIYKLHGNLKLEQVARCAKFLTGESPFKELSPETRNDMLLQQKILVDLELDRAIDSLANLLTTVSHAERARQLIDTITSGGSSDDIQMKKQWHHLLSVLNPSSKDIQLVSGI